LIVQVYLLAIKKKGTVMGYSDYFENKLDDLLKENRLIVAERLPQSNIKRVISDTFFADKEKKPIEEAINFMFPESVHVEGRTIFVIRVRNDRKN